MIIADFTVDNASLRETRRRVPDIRVEWEDSNVGPDGALQALVWVESDDFEKVDAALDDDPSAANQAVLVEADGRRLYRFDFAGRSRETSIVPVLIELGGVLKESVGDEGGWRCQARFPDREPLQRLFHFCRDNDVEFRLHRIYDQADDVRGGDSLGRLNLTDKQRRTLVTAWERGYFDVPRKITLVQLAARLDISDTAVSHRIRRAVANLVAQVVVESAEESRREP